MDGFRGAPPRIGFRVFVWASAVLVLTASLAFAAPRSSLEPAAGGRAFADFVASLWPMAETLGVSRQTFGRAFAGVGFDPGVVAQTTRQAEFTVPIWDYLSLAVSSVRIARGREKARAVSPWLDKANRTYGVDPSALMGIWGLESDYGASSGTFDVVRSLASLAFIRFRDTYFRDELLNALAILEQGDVAPRAMVGSWAGAMGQTQLMPSSFVAFAVDFDSGGRRDVWSNEADAIGSAANFLAGNGWTRGLPWGFEVVLPAGFALADADSAEPAPFSAFAARGVVRADGKPLPAVGAGRLLLPAGLKGPIFLVTSNFYVIKAYNASTAYALGVALLGDAVMGGAGLVASWPRTTPALSPGQVRDLQARLKKMGYDPGEVDGMVGDGLRSAVRKYQERSGLAPDGYADLGLLKRIESDR